uniref:Uncharacterized protein n=1 Tax=Tolypothrix bouteillei VB521301 TaxID=1479485 RepID=A0A0C1NEQ3_9CYAN
MTLDISTKDINEAEPNTTRAENFSGFGSPSRNSTNACKCWVSFLKRHVTQRGEPSEVCYWGKPPSRNFSPHVSGSPTYLFSYFHAKPSSIEAKPLKMHSQAEPGNEIAKAASGLLLWAKFVMHNPSIKYTLRTFSI